MKNVLITGGAGGIGSEISKVFLEKGYFVLIVDTDAAAGEKLVEQYGADKCRMVQLDVTDNAALEQFAASLGEAFALNHIITLAGRALEDEWIPFVRQGMDMIERSVKVNLLGHIGAVHAFLPCLQRGDGDKSVLMIATINAMTNFGLPGYSAAKAGLTGFVNAMVGEFGKEGIRINTISPGTVVTEATLTEPKDWDALRKTTAINRFAPAEEVAKMAFGICEEFTSVTGQNFVIDAGQTKMHSV